MRNCEARTPVGVLVAVAVAVAVAVDMFCWLLLLLLLLLLLFVAWCQVHPVVLHPLRPAALLWHWRRLHANVLPSHPTEQHPLQRTPHTSLLCTRTLFLTGRGDYPPSSNARQQAPPSLTQGRCHWCRLARRS